MSWPRRNLPTLLLNNLNAISDYLSLVAINFRFHYIVLHEIDNGVLKSIKFRELPSGENEGTEFLERLVLP